MAKNGKRPGRRKPEGLSWGGAKTPCAVAALVVLAAVADTVHRATIWWGW
jgi:hypothetical protein